MKTRELDYELPKALIAQRPAEVRSQSRLLVLKRGGGEVVDSRFSQLGEYLQAGDCLVLNDTKVLPARFYGRRKSGAKLEGLFLGGAGDSGWQVMLKGMGKVKESEEIILKDKNGGDSVSAKIVEKLGAGKCLLKVSSDKSAEDILEEIGFAPLPPYIKRDSGVGQAQIDERRYQTVYARQAGAVAAPTAGLHFTDELMGQLKEAGVRFAYVTLHVGWGTFKPISAETVEEHKIHSEWFKVDEENARVINEAKEKGGRIIAVGTTSTRVLETIAEDSKVSACSGQTELFIKPGYEFKMVDCLVTNFHLPRSSLLLLVGAFAGLGEMLAAYKHAIEKRYRFYSYGDAMLII